MSALSITFRRRTSGCEATGAEAYGITLVLHIGNIKWR